ncbi:MAG: hypothetical protein ACPG6P_01975 [Akkermansiaceae bacterium]
MHELLPIGVATTFLGVKSREWRRLVDEDDFPVIKIPGRTRPCHKVQPRMLWLWLKNRSSGEFLSYDEFLQELEAYLVKRNSCKAEA